MGDVTVEAVAGLRGLHPEGPLWDADTARLWWVDIAGERVHCYDPASGADCSWGTDGQPGGVVLDPAGQPLVAAPDGLTTLDRTTGSLRLRVAVERDHPENRANDAKVDGRGRVWVGTMAFDKRPGNAALYVVDEFDLDPDSGVLSGRRRLADLGDVGIWPDGMTVDDAGMLWVAMGRAGAVHRYRADGTLDGVVEVPTTNPTSVAFGGADGGDLYITTSWVDCEPHARTEPLTGAVFRCRPGVTGPPSPRCAVASRALDSSSPAK